jgi:radical SAM superfamily enzyme YgiQ (UPF0313 family)
MRVLLINPPAFHELAGHTPSKVESNRGFLPPLGILSVAGYLAQYTDHAVEVLDTQPPGWTYEQVAEEIARREFDIAGISTMTFTLIDAIRTCQIIRRVKPQAKIVLGGPHTHLYPEETLRHDCVDFIIQGEGEVAFTAFLDHFRDKARWPQIRGLAYRDDEGRVVNGGIAAAIEDLDRLAFPARHLIDNSRYYSLLGKADSVTTMFTSRGCPFRCTFCDRPGSPILSGFRWRSASNIADEMELCVNMGIKEALIYDDTFSVRKDRVHQLCDEILARKLKFRWDVRAHVNTIDRDLLRHMREAGCDRIHFGVESGNDRMLKVIRKNTTVERVKTAFRLAHEVGIETLAYFMIGQQTETRADIQDSIDLARQLRPRYVNFAIFTPLPGTAIYAEGLERGLIKKDVWREFANNPTADFVLPVWEEQFTRDELYAILVRCMRDFYMRPGYILRQLLSVRSVGEFARKAAAGLGILTTSTVRPPAGR